VEELNIIKENFDNAIKMLERMREEGTLLNEAELAEGYKMRGLFHTNTNNLSEAVNDFSEAIEILENIRDSDRQCNENLLADIYMARAISFHTLGASEYAIEDATKCIEILESLIREDQQIDKMFLFSMYKLRASELHQTGDYPNMALSDFHKSIEIAENLQVTGEPFDRGLLISAHIGVAESYGQMEKFEESNMYCNKCLALLMQMQTVGEELDADKLDSLALVYMNRGSNYCELENYENALSDYSSSIEVRERLQSEGVQQDAFDMFMAYKNRSQLYEMLVDCESEAIDDVISAMRELKKAFGLREELQEVYYDVLDEAIELIEEEGDKAQLDSVLDEFLHSMRTMEKTHDAEMVQNRILEKLSKCKTPWKRILTDSRSTTERMFGRCNKYPSIKDWNCKECGNGLMVCYDTGGDFTRCTNDSCTEYDVNNPILEEPDDGNFVRDYIANLFCSHCGGNRENDMCESCGKAK